VKPPVLSETVISHLIVTALINERLESFVFDDVIVSSWLDIAIE